MREPSASRRPSPLHAHGSALPNGREAQMARSAPASAAAGGSALETVGSAAGALKIDVHDFVPDGYAGAPEPKVHLLYRPGHYDVLYPLAG